MSGPEGMGKLASESDVSKTKETHTKSFFPFYSNSPKGFNFGFWKRDTQKKTDPINPVDSKISDTNTELLVPNSSSALIGGADTNDSSGTATKPSQLDYEQDTRSDVAKEKTPPASIRSSANKNVASSSMHSSGNLRASPVQDAMIALGARIGAQVIVGLKGSEQPAAEAGASLHDGNSFASTSQWSSPRFESPRREETADLSLLGDPSSCPCGPEESARTPVKDWFSSIRKFFKRKEKQVIEPNAQTGRRNDDQRRDARSERPQAPPTVIDNSPHYLGSDHENDPNMRRHRGYLAWNSLIALGFALYIGASLSVTARNWLFLELGMEDRVAANYTTFKETMKLATFFLLLYLFAHRLAAVIVGLILRIALRKRLIPDGTFTIHMGWFSYRGPFDGSQIVISNLMWRNPPLFRRTPYLLNCKRLSVSFSLWNLGKMIFYGREFIFDEILIDGLVVYFDRHTTSVTEDSLNLWAAIGATDKESEKWFFRAFLKSILMAIKNRIKKSTSITHILKLDRLKRRDRATLDAESDDEYEYEGDRSSRASDESVRAASTPADVTSDTGGVKPSELSAALEALSTDVSMRDDSSLKTDIQPTKSSTSNTPLRRSRTRAAGKKGTDTPGPSPPAQRLPTVVFNHLIVYDLVAYPLDLLTETHSEHVMKDATTVRIKKFTLDRDDITGKPTVKNGPRIPLPADDFGDKFGDAFGGALVKNNTYQIASIFAHSYANRILKIKGKDKKPSLMKNGGNSSTSSVHSSTSTVIGKVVAIHDPATYS